MDGQSLVTQDHKDHTIAQLAVMCASEEPSLMHITRRAYMLDSKYQELIPKSCQDNGSSRLDLALVLRWVITFRLVGISS